MRSVVVWFKNDLRLEDHEALFKACEQPVYVLPIYVIDPRQFEQHPLGFYKSGSFRIQFLLESLNNLRENLRNRGADLIIRTGYPEIVIPEIAKTVNAQCVYTAQEVASDELRIVEQTERALLHEKIKLETYWQNSLYHIEDIPWPIHRLPDVFTQFRKEAEQESQVRTLFPVPEKILYRESIAPGQLPDYDSFDVDPIQHDPRAAFKFSGGETHANLRLEEYIWKKECIKTYKETRNELIGTDYSSKLSAWLANGSISPRKIYWEVKKYESQKVKNDSTYWLVFELLWRDYFRFVGKKYGAQIFHSSGLQHKQLSLINDRALFEKWRTGNTGVDFIDANMRELLHTGYMSNRGRQNVASFLVKQLHVNWLWGAAWFESQLVDYDVTSNWLNWAYLAGVGNDPRENRIFVIDSQEKKYDPQRQYIKLWLSDVSVQHAR